jgi:hypothetical protein
VVARTSGLIRDSCMHMKSRHLFYVDTYIHTDSHALRSRGCAAT